MDLHCDPVAFAAIGDVVVRHLASLPGKHDSILEEHLRAFVHFGIVVTDDVAGLTSIYDERLVTQFALAGRFQRYGQSIVHDVRRLEHVSSAFVPTFDEYVLSHALNDYRPLAKQGHVFAMPDDASPAAVPEEQWLRLAVESDIAMIHQESGDLFGDIEQRLSRHELFATMRGDALLGCGVMEPSSLYDSVASIGMFTRSRHRRKGTGTATIALLLAACRQQGFHALAGCWHDNHRSKRTLDRAGMVTATRLLKVDYESRPR